jgi:hypothetical protein
LGFGAGLARFLIAVPELEARGRVPLVDGRPSGVASLARSARLGWPGRLPASPARAGLFEAAGAGAILARVERDPGAVASGRLALSPLRENLALMGAVFLGRV